MRKGEIDKQIIEHFRERHSFDRRELLDFYQRFEPDLNNRTFGWRVFDLKKKNIIESVGRGIYRIAYKPKFKPQLSDKIEAISEIIVKELTQYEPDVNIKKEMCIWDTSWLNEFTNHQLMATFIIVEIASDFLERYYHTLKDEDLGRIFYEPEPNIFEKYLPNEDKPIVIKKMISRSPTQKINSISIAALEKILVDVFCDKKYFMAVHGRELENIFRFAIGKYSINFSTLLNYSRRRRREDELKEYFAMQLNDLMEDVFI